MALIHIKPELAEGDHIECMGYTIKSRLDCPGELGYVVTKDGWNPMPGAAWFRTVGEARKGIAALIVSNAFPPLDPKTHGEIFWALIELTK